jgi:hypothetical protein
MILYYLYMHEAIQHNETIEYDTKQLTIYTYYRAINN